jgi:peptide/nickel transport system substrate-binding protein
VLSVFDQYHNVKPFIEKVMFKYYPDPASAIYAYKNGEVMGIGSISQDILMEGLASEDLRMYTGRMPLMSMLYFNLKDPDRSFFQEKDVRKALMMAINRQWIIDRLMGGQAVLADGPILPGSWAHYDALDQIAYDPEAARNLLKEAGYTIPAEGGEIRAKEGTRLEFDLVYPADGNFQAIAEAIQQDWAKIGVRANLEAVPYRELVENYLEPRTYQAAMIDLDLTGSPDPDPYPFWHQTQIIDGQNYAGWDDRQASEYLEQARVQDDFSERAKLYHNFQVRWANELPAIPLFIPVFSYGVDRQVLGVQMGALFQQSDRFNTLPSWFLLARETVGTSTGSTPVP